MNIRKLIGDDRSDDIKAVIVIACLVLIPVGLYVFMSYQEARSYNKLTGGHVTTWDAMFVDLRVMGKED